MILQGNLRKESASYHITYSPNLDNHVQRSIDLRFWGLVELQRLVVFDDTCDLHLYNKRKG